MATESGSLTVYPGAYDASASSFKSISGATNPVGKGSDNTTYADITINTGAFAETYVFWPFDLSAIPNGANINSVSCKIKVRHADPFSYTLEASAQLYTGNTPKGDSYNNLTNEVQTLNLSTGTWSEDELRNCRLRLYAKRKTSSTTATVHMYFYGADLTVTYTYQSEKFMLKLGGAWHDIARVFKKVNGIWVEQTDLANVIEDGVRYQNGGEYVAPKKTVTVTGTGNSSVAYVTINGTKYTSAASIQVNAGDVITATVGGSNPEDSSITADGTRVVHGKAGSYNYTVQSDCTVTLSYTNDDFFGTSGDITIVST